MERKWKEKSANVELFQIKIKADKLLYVSYGLSFLFPIKYYTYNTIPYARAKTRFILGIW